MLPSEVDWAEVNGVSLRYAVSGRGPTPLVLIHEMGGSIESWDETLPLLEGRLRVIRYDQRGFGLSEKNTCITLPVMLADLEALLNHLGISEPVCLAGAHWARHWR